MILHKIQKNLQINCWNLQQILPKSLDIKSMYKNPFYVSIPAIN